MKRCLKFIKLGLVSSFIISALLLEEKAFAKQGIVRDAILEDFSDIVTQVDIGFNDFSGNVGMLNNNNQNYGKRELVCKRPDSCALQFEWNFGIDEDGGLSPAFSSPFLGSRIQKPPLTEGNQ